LVIELHEKTEQFNEIVVKSHKLIGVLEIDAKNVPLINMHEFISTVFHKHMKLVLLTEKVIIRLLTPCFNPLI